MSDTLLDADGSALFTDAEKAAIAFAKEVTATGGASEATFARVARHFDERQIVELTMNVSVANMNNRLTDALGTDLEEPTT